VGGTSIFEVASQQGRGRTEHEVYGSHERRLKIAERELQRQQLRETLHDAVDMTPLEATVDESQVSEACHQQHWSNQVPEAYRQHCRDQAAAAHNFDNSTFWSDIKEDEVVESQEVPKAYQLHCRDQAAAARNLKDNTFWSDTRMGKVVVPKAYQPYCSGQEAAAHNLGDNNFWSYTRGITDIES
jgi:hypothetical protein